MPSTSSVNHQNAHAAASRQERPRQRLTVSGANSLSTAELLAVCLGAGVRGEDAVSMSHRLLLQFGGLDGLLAAPTEVLLECHGLGVARAALLKAMHELTKRSDESVLARPQPLTDASQVTRYVQRRIAHCRREVFGCLFMDTRHRPICWEILFAGTLNRAHVHSREILKRGIDLDAAAIVLAHNHPSGIAEPSHADIALTRELRDLLARIDIVVLDHIIVAPGSAVSLATRGLMGGTNPSCSKEVPVV